MLPPSLPPRLELWKVNVDASALGKVAEASLPGPFPREPVQRDVAVTRLAKGDIIMATRIGTAMELSRWQINEDGGLTLLASGIAAGTANTMGLQPVAPDMLLTAATNPEGAVVLKAWRLQGSGLADLDTYMMGGGWTEVAIAGPLTTDVYGGHNAVTAAVLSLGNTLAHQVWSADPATGEITRLSSRLSSAKGSHVTLSPFPVTPAFDGELLPSYYVTGFKDSLGDLPLRFVRIDTMGDPVDEGSGNA